MFNSSVTDFKDRIVLVLVYLMVFMVPVSQVASSWLLGILFITSFFVARSGFGITSYAKNAWDLILYFFVLVIGLFFSKDVSFGLKVIESNLSFVILPFVLGRYVFGYSIKLEKLVTSFNIGLSVACVICLLKAGITYAETNDIRVFFSNELTKILGFQPTYFAYYLIFSLTYWLYYLFFDDHGYFSVKTIVVLIVFLFILLLLTGGQTTFIALSLILGFFILKFLTEKQTRRRWFSFLLSTTMLSFMFVFSYVVSRNPSSFYSDGWDRMILWESAINAGPNYLVGVGTGDYKSALNQYYLENNLKEYADGAYNSHNQFIQTLFSNGMFGVIAMLLMVIRPLYFSYKNTGLFEVLIFFPFVLYGMTEVFLGRYQGIILFVFLHQLCILIREKNTVQGALKS